MTVTEKRGHGGMWRGACVSAYGCARLRSEEGQVTGAPKKDCGYVERVELLEEARGLGRCHGLNHAVLESQDLGSAEGVE